MSSEGDDTGTDLVVTFEIKVRRLYLLLIPIGKHMRMKGTAHRNTIALLGIPLMRLKSSTKSPMNEARMLILKIQ